MALQDPIEIQDLTDVLLKFLALCRRIKASGTAKNVARTIQLLNTPTIAAARAAIPTVGVRCANIASTMAAATAIPQA
jgi:hypothetical protein